MTGKFLEVGHLCAALRRRLQQPALAAAGGAADDLEAQPERKHFEAVDDLPAVILVAAFELLRDSLWGPKKFYRAARFDTAGATITLASGALDPVSGKSYHQLAMAGRSLHRSQEMGQIQGLGASVTRLALIESAGGGDQTPARQGDLFAGIDTTLGPGLARYVALVDSARAALTPRDPARIVPLLTGALAEMRRSGAADIRAAKEPLLEEAIANAAGVVVAA